MISKIVKTRQLPAPGRTLVETGQVVGARTPVCEVGYIPGPLFKVGVAGALGLDPKHLDDVMLKKPGEWVEAGEQIAVSDQFYTERAIASPRSGAIGLVSRTLGFVYVREPLPTGPKEPVVVRAEDEGCSKFTFATGLQVDVGKTVELGQTLVSPGITLAFRGKQGSGRNALRSPVFGKITDISLRDATITIKPLRKSTEVLAHIAGKVTAVNPNHSVEVTTYGYVIEGVVGYGAESVGTLTVLPQGANRDLDCGDLPAELSGKVIVGCHSMTVQALRRCLEGGASAVVLGAATRGALRDALGSDPLRAVGAAADAAMAIVLVSGFGRLSMAPDTYSQLVDLDGHEASVDGSTQLRAGVVRPEVIIPVSEDQWPAEDGTVSSGTSKLSLRGDDVQVGSKVMIIREPEFGAIGPVISLSTTPVALASGASAITAVIMDERDGREIVVPLANLRSIEEA